MIGNINVRASSIANASQILQQQARVPPIETIKTTTRVTILIDASHHNQKIGHSEGHDVGQLGGGGKLKVIIVLGPRNIQ